MQNVNIDIYIESIDFTPTNSQGSPRIMNANQLITQSDHSVIARKIAMQQGEHDKPHKHLWHQIIMAKTGALRTRSSFKEYFVPFNRAVFIPAGHEHESWAVTSAEFLGIYLKPEKLPSTMNQCKILELSSLYRELVFHWVESTSPLNPPSKREERLADVIFDLTQSQREVKFELALPRDPRINTIADQLLADPTNPVPLSAWAQRANTSARTIERLFKNETDLTFTQWRQRLRLYHSLSLLEKNTPVKTVALSVGYRSASAFIYRFKSEFGVTPYQYNASSQFN